MMNDKLLKIAAGAEAVVLATLLVAMPLIWWTPRSFVFLLAIPVWGALAFLGFAHRRKRREAGYSLARHLAFASMAYLPFLVLAAIFRASTVSP